MIHELNHLWRMAPDGNSVFQLHYPEGNKCWLDQNTTYKISKQGAVDWIVPDASCRATRNAVADGFTSSGATHCGDFTFDDGDGIELCASVGP
jgi:hypothetical protein